MTNHEIATTILEQLGGGVFRMMTGARDFIAIERGLRFKLPSNFARGPHGCVNLVTIELTPADTYRVKFERVRAGKVTTLDEVFDVYVDTLRETFERCTGLVIERPRVLRVRECVAGGAL